MGRRVAPQTLATACPPPPARRWGTRLPGPLPGPPPRSPAADSPAANPCPPPAARRGGKRPEPPRRAPTRAPRPRTAARRGAGAATLTSPARCVACRSAPGPGPGPRDGTGPERYRAVLRRALLARPLFHSKPVVRRCLAASASLFALVVGDQGLKLGLLRPLDVTVRALAQGGAGDALRATAVPGLLSNVLMSLVGCAAALAAGAAVVTVLPTVPEGKPKWRIFGLLDFLPVTAALVAMAGDFGSVHVLKTAFRRARPSTLFSPHLDPHSSFPSGHVTAVTFLTATFLWVLVPLMLEILGKEELRRWYKGWRPLQYALWVAATCTTAAGRILLDVHWTTDCIGGFALGALLFASELICIEKIGRVLGGEGGGGG